MTEPIPRRINDNAEASERVASLRTARQAQRISSAATCSARGWAPAVDSGDNEVPGRADSRLTGELAFDYLSSLSDLEDVVRVTIGHEDI